MSAGVEGGGTAPTGAPVASGSTDPMSVTTAGPWQYAQAAAVLLVLGFFLYALQSVLNPFLLFFVLWAVLVPFRRTPAYVPVLLVAAALTLFWLLATTGSLLAPFVLALVLAYILDPPLDWLQSKGLPRVLAIVLLTLPVLGVLALLFFVAIPSAVAELAELSQRAPELARRAADWVDGLRSRLLVMDMPFLDEDALVERLRSVDSDTVVAFMQERRDALMDWLWTGALGVGRGVGAILGILGYVVLTPMLTFYLMRDWDRLTATLRDLVPERRKAAVVDFAEEYDGLLARYLRGQATVALAIGALTALGLWIAQFPYAGTLGLIVTLFSVVPYLGLILSLIPAIFIALVSGSVWVSLGKVALVYGIAQGLEGAVISPRIVGDSVGLHPVLVVLALALGGFFFGFVGLLIAVPVAVGVKLVVIRAIVRYRDSSLYRDAGTVGGTTETF